MNATKCLDYRFTKVKQSKMSDENDTTTASGVESGQIALALSSASNIKYCLYMAEGSIVFFSNFFLLSAVFRQHKKRTQK